jgi:hypothetical protein
MEDRQYDPNNTEETSTESAEDKQRHGNFLSQFLARRKGEKLDSLDTDDDDETLEKPKRWRAKFKGFFKNVVPPPESEIAAPKDPPTAELFAWPFAQAVRAESGPANVPPASGVEATSAVAGPELPKDVDPTEQVTEAAQIDTLIESQTADVPEASQEDTIPISDRNHELPQSELPIETNRGDNEASVRQSVERQRSGAYEGEITIPHHENSLPAPESRQPRIEKETVVERGVGSALPVALVAAEYIGRKRADRKITETFTKKTDHLQKGATEAQRAHEQLDQLLRQNREQLETLKQERGISNHTTPETLVSSSPVLASERLNPEAPMSQPERKPEIRIDQKENTVPAAETEPKPQHIMEQVAKAAEADVPVERVFERSHEVKDDSSSVTGFGAGAASVGSIMSQRSTQTPTSVPTASKRQSTSSLVDNLPFVTEQTPELYKQAMNTGFVAGIVIIVFGLFAYLMIK